MIVHCESCGTDFRLDDTMVKPEGSWVRCSKCKEVFQVFSHDEAPAQPAPMAAVQPAPAQGAKPGSKYDDEAFSDLLGDDADDYDVDGMIDLDGGERPLEDSLSDFEFNVDEAKNEGKGPGLIFKLVFWLVGLLLVAVVVVVGGGLALKHLGLESGMMAKVAKVPGVSQVLSLVGVSPSPAAAPGAAPAGKPGAPSAAPAPEPDTPYTLLALRGVKSYFRFNEQAGRIFVIEGLVDNKGDRNRTRVMVVGRLHSAKGKVEMKQTVYAGPLLNQDQLKVQSMMEIQASLSKPTDAAGKPYVLNAGQTIPFMIVFAKLPENLAEYTAEVVGSKPAPRTPQPGQ